MSDIKYTSPLLKYTQYKNAIISISPDGFTFSVHSPDVKHILLFNHYKFNNLKLEDELLRKVGLIIQNEPLLKEKYMKVDVAFISQKSTLVPQEFFSKENLKKYFEFSQNLDEYDEIHFTHIPEIDAYSVFTLPNILSNEIFSIQPDVTFHNQSASLIQSGIKKKNKTSLSAVIGFNSDFFDLVIFQQNKLALYNSFQYANSTDLIYFFLYACQQLKIDHKDIVLTAFGEAINEKNLLKELKKYVKEIEKPSITLPFEIKPLHKEDFVKFYLHSFLCV